MAGFLRASVFAAVVVVSCSSPMGPQGEQGPPGPPGTGTGPGTCDAPRMTCGNACVDVQTDPKNCGACGVVCTDACVGGACCGDGKKNGSEQCDKSDLGGATCAQAAAPGWSGTAGCTPACKLDATGCMTPSTMWSDFTSTSNWSVFDVSSVNGGARGFNGALYDGRYVYLVPHYNGGYDGVVARYDTQSSFTVGGSWAVFDVASIYGGARGFTKAAFDGRYVYFVPHYNGGSYHGVVARYDTQSAFTMASSWSAFDLTVLYPGARGFQGAVFDGRYLYFVPNYNGGYHGLVVRYDTQGAFGFSGSWAAFDLTTIHVGARGFVGGTFDGRYVYLAPNNGATNSIATRYDTQAPFGSSAAWKTFDLTAFSPGAKGYYGAVFDGRYVYYAPYNNGSAYHGLVARVDTQMDFDAMGAWAAFDVSTVNGAARGFTSIAFDGKHVYLVPHYNGAYHGTVARYDTSAPFGMGGSWSIHDVSPMGTRGFLGSAYDGRYLYLSPYYNGGGHHGVVARFDTKSVSWLPKGWQYSQF